MYILTLAHRIAAGLMESDSHVLFNFNDASNPFVAADNLTNTPYLTAKASATGAILQVTREQLLTTQAGHRDNTSTIVLLAVDGRTQEDNDTLFTQVQALRDLGVKIIVIGIDIVDPLDLQELLAIAGSNSSYYSLADLEALALNASALQSQFLQGLFCVEIVPQPFCPYFVPTDFVYVLDGSGSMQQTKFDRVTRMFAEISYELPIYKNLTRFVVDYSFTLTKLHANIISGSFSFKYSLAFTHSLTHAHTHTHTHTLSLSLSLSLHLSAFQQGCCGSNGNRLVCDL